MKAPWAHRGAFFFLGVPMMSLDMLYVTLALANILLWAAARVLVSHPEAWTK